MSAARVSVRRHPDGSRTYATRCKVCEELLSVTLDRDGVLGLSMGLIALFDEAHRH